jgi:predicted protein tyrosine phosphatase
MRLIVCAQDQAPEAVRDHAPTHGISLVSPGMAPAALGLPAERHLVLRFNDIDAPRADCVPPTEDAVLALLGFAARLPPDSRLLIHCFAGISRSPAAAYAVACQALGPGQEALLAGVLRQRSPEATPNRLLVALADKALSRCGAMQREIDAIGRGAGAFSGRTFCLPIKPKT